MKQITNLTTRPVVLDDGTILAAAKTKGSVKQVESVSEFDVRRLGSSIHISDVTVESKVPRAKSEDAARTARKDAGAPVAEGEK